MSQSRKDKKNRTLYKGEYQRANGLYEYRCKNKLTGASQSLYSWRLKPEDPQINGNKNQLSLRELESMINRDNQDGIDTISARKLCLDDLFEKYIRERPLKQSTRTNYKYMYKNYISGALGKKKLSDIKYSDIKHFYNFLIESKGFKPNSMEVINTILNPIFSTAVRDDFIRKNPVHGVMAEIKARRDWSKPKRLALTTEQQGAFVDYITSSAKHRRVVPLLTLLLGTGCRVGEIIGLRWQDCDFENKLISINHNLIYRLQDTGKCEFHITTPKTAAGVRIIPMFDEVKNALSAEYAHQQAHGFNNAVIDGYSGFIFKNRYNNVYSPHGVNRCIAGIIKEYNKEETEKSEVENRAPVLLPHFSAHNLRHTFCSRLCENESNRVNLKVIQEIMGHSSIDTTLDIYTDLTTKIKQDAFESLQGRIKLS